MLFHNLATRHHEGRHADFHSLLKGINSKRGKSPISLPDELQKCFQGTFYGFKQRTILNSTFQLNFNLSSRRCDALINPCLRRGASGGRQE